jgi:hypothetical protein
MKKVVEEVSRILMSRYKWPVGLIGIECWHQSQVRNSMSRRFVLCCENRGEGIDDMERVVLW